MSQKFIDRFLSPPSTEVTSPSKGRPAAASTLTGPREEAYSVVLQVIVVQYDRKKYAGSLERLLGKLAGLGVDTSVLVVDNFTPGDWVHRVTKSLTHIGGDNSGWEFTAFDRGLAYLDKIGARAEVVALVTDAHAAYGDEFLSLITPRLIRTVAKQKGAVGWIDSWPEPTTLFGKTYQDWLRTSFVLLPASIVSAVRPLATQFDTRAMFSSNPKEPFLPSAPLGDRLRQYLVEWLSGTQGSSLLQEGWHSQFALDEKSMQFFQAKVSAIVREHSLSQKLRDAGIVAYDFRLLKRLFDGGFQKDELDAPTLAPFAWSRWAAHDDARVFLPIRHHIDRQELPHSVVHGDPVNVRVEGWVLASPQPSFVHLRTGAESRLSAPCSQHREDVVMAFPGYKVRSPGFILSGTIRDLPHGVHAVSIDTGAAGSIQLGSITVNPLFDFSPRRTAVPASWPLGQPVPFSVEGDVRSSFPVEGVEIRVDGTLLEATAFVGEPKILEGGIFEHGVVCNGVAPALSGNIQHTLEFRFALEGGSFQTWSLPFTLTRTEIPCTLREISIGPFDANTGLTAVKLEVSVYDVSPGDRLILERNGVEVLDAELRVADADDHAGARKALIAFDRQVPRIPPNAAEFSLVRKRAGQRSLVWKGVYLVRPRQPQVHLEAMQVTLLRPEEPPTYRIYVKGWVQNHFLVDCLFIDINDSRAAVLGMYELRPDVSEALSNPAICRQGFEETVEVTQITPGEHVVHLVATQQGGESSRASHRAVFENIPARRVTVASDDAERLVRGLSNNFYGAITLRGTVHSRLEEVSVTLFVDGRVLDESVFRGSGKHEFAVRGVPEKAGEYPVRLLVSSQGRPLHEVGPVLVTFRPIDVPETLAKDLGVILDRFDVRSRLAGYAGDEDMLRRLVEQQPERITEFSEMLAEAAAHARAPKSGARSSDAEPRSERRRLKVLFATWEVPSRDHGGGVYLRHLLTRLGKLHDITLVHTYSIDEAGQVEALRPYMRRIISVPRAFAPAQYRGSGRFPVHLYDVYLPELRRVMELEVASGGYDVVDYEYSAMGPYVIQGPPSVLTVHELGFTAMLNSAFSQGRAMEVAVKDVDRFLRSFHYFTHELPSLCNHLVTLTEEDASEIATYADARVFTNPGGVEVDEWPVWKASAPRKAPVLAFVGNYQHPPNVRAVQYFAHEVMPLLRKIYPSAELVVYGSRMSPAVRELDGVAGVRVAGFVDDLRGRLRDATAMVAPLFTGTGQRIKVLEAFGAGALVIGTDLSIRGLSAVDGQHYYAANNAAQFVDAVVRATEFPDEAARVARAGQELAGTAHSWESAARRRESIWFETVADGPRPKGSPSRS